MPIRPEMKPLYPDNWGEIVAEVRERSGGVCEWEGCAAKDRKPHPLTGSIVVLTVAHLDHYPPNCAMGNLRHWCQLHHNRYDAKHRVEGIRERRRMRDGQSELI